MITCQTKKVTNTVNLGELEKAALQFFWEYGDADAKQVYAYFEPKRGGTLNTIQSTLDRLYKKGLLKRHKTGYAYVYQAEKTKDDFIGELFVDLTKDFFESPESALHAAFSSISSSLSDKEISELEALIDRQRTMSDVE